MGSPRIAPHHSYTPRPFIGGTSTKNEDTSAGVKRKIDDVESSKAPVAFLKSANDYLKTWTILHAANPIPNWDEKSKIMSDTGLSESQLDAWMRAWKNANKKKDKNDKGLTDEQKKEKDLKKKVNEEMNNFLSAWLLRPENVQSNPIVAATPTAEVKEWLAKQLGQDRARIDSWFYRRRKKLKKQHMPDSADQASNHSTTAVSATSPVLQPPPQPLTQATASATNIANPPSASKNQSTINPNLNLPSNHQMPQNQNSALTAKSTVQNQVAVVQSVSALSSSTSSPSSKQTGLSDEAKQYLTQWLIETSNPYPSKERKDKIMAHFGIENTRTLDGFLTRTRKKLNLQNKQSSVVVSTQTNHSLPASVSTATQPGASTQTNQSQAAAQPSTEPSHHAQMHSTQNATAGNFQSALRASPMQSSNLDSLLTAVELVNSQKQYTQPPRSRHAPNQIGQTHLAPPASAMGVGSPQYRQSNVGQQHQYHRQQQHQQQQQHHHHRLSHSPLMDTGTASRYQIVQNRPTYHSGQQQQYSHSSHAQQFQPTQTREQSILMAYQNLQEMEIHDRSSSRSSPAEVETTARPPPMQNAQGNPQYNAASNFTASANGSQAHHREN